MDYNFDSVAQTGGAADHATPDQHARGYLLDQQIDLPHPLNPRAMARDGHEPQHRKPVKHGRVSTP